MKQLLDPQMFDDILSIEPAQVWFVDRRPEYLAALAHTEIRPAARRVNLVEFLTEAFDPQTAVIDPERGLGNGEADPVVYPWVCSHPGIWVLMPGGVFHNYEDHFILVPEDDDGDH